MNWTELVAKAKKNHARSSRMGARGTLLMFGAICAGAGALNLYSIVAHQIHGRPAIATLVERSQQCTLAYQLMDGQKRKERWPCGQAEEFQRFVGANKVQLSRDYIARVRFAREDGHTHEADVDEFHLDSYGLAIGATLPVTYSPDDPSDVRAKMTWRQFNVSMILMAVGLPFLMVGFGIPLSAPFRWAFRGRASRAGEAAAP